MKMHQTADASISAHEAQIVRHRDARRTKAASPAARLRAKAKRWKESYNGIAFGYVVGRLNWQNFHGRPSTFHYIAKSAGLS